MNFDTYQKACARTKNTKLSPELFLATIGLGLGGESGEIEDTIKKVIGHGHPMEPHKMLVELGDIMWYVAMIAEHYGLSLVAIADYNVNVKLKKRYPNGFTEERSLNREEG